MRSTPSGRVLQRRVERDDDLGTIVWPNGADIAPETLHGWVVQGGDQVSA